MNQGNLIETNFETDTLIYRMQSIYFYALRISSVLLRFKFIPIQVCERPG